MSYIRVIIAMMAIVGVTLMKRFIHWDTGKG